MHMHSMHHHQRRARPLISVALVHLPLAFPAAQLISQLARRGRAIAGRGAGARKASQPLPGGSTRRYSHCTLILSTECLGALRGSGWGGCYGFAVIGDVPHSIVPAPALLSLIYTYTHNEYIKSFIIYMPGYRYGTHSYTKSAVDPLSKRWCSRLHCLHNTGRSSKKCLAHTHAPHRRTGTAHPTQPAQPPIPFPPLAACYYYLLTACPAEARRRRLAAALEGVRLRGSMQRGEGAVTACRREASSRRAGASHPA